MNWRDLFYFSKGERRALTLLLCLITISWILLLWTDMRRMPVDSQTENQRTSDEKQIIIGKETFEQKTDSVRKQPISRPAPTITGNKNNPASKKRKEYSPYARTKKYTEGTLVELNTADTTILKKVPGIGSSFARRIIKYRELLGGFYHVSQLAEVYGIDEERYRSLAPWFVVDTFRIHRLAVNSQPTTMLRKHPYLNYRQAKAIEQLRKQKSRLSGWENLQLLDEFTDTDKKRLTPYLSFE